MVFVRGDSAIPHIFDYHSMSFSQCFYLRLGVWFRQGIDERRACYPPAGGSPDENPGCTDVLASRAGAGEAAPKFQCQPISSRQKMTRRDYTPCWRFVVYFRHISAKLMFYPPNNRHLSGTNKFIFCTFLFTQFFKNPNLN
jgi:hypothetical protein